METESQPLMELEPPTLRNSERPKTRHRRRRRSSARFLRLTGRLMEDIDEEEEEDENIESEQHLGDMYKKAIRMNAENRINATNSWNLRLIENIDKFLEEDPADGESPQSSISSSPEPGVENADPNKTKRKNGGKKKRVNFTKASCTLDASVKIYSYRVDDVHLTSYKVLANLNRTDNTKESKEKAVKENSAASQEAENSTEHDELADSDDEAPAKASSSNAGSTLETNKSNINMNKLDSAFDIDPLFHKLSKTFDEGGAKGLLLVNLGVGDKGCNIVFDSKAEYEEDSKKSDCESDEEDAERQDGMIDISSLRAKLDSTCGLNAAESLELVPQLASLREQQSELKAEGFVEEVVRASRRYASTQEEEKEADMSIHQEALERSRVSQGDLGKSFLSTQNSGAGYYDGDDDDDGVQFAPDDFGGGDDDDAGFEDFIALDNNAARFSSISFQDSFASGQRNNTQSQADVLLDAICSGNVLAGGEYEYFNTQNLMTTVAGNQWAGSAHWKRTEPIRKRQENKDKEKKTTSKTPKKRKGKGRSCVDLLVKPVLEDILRKPPKKKGGASPLQLSKAMITKYSKEEHLLPPDSGIGVEKLAGLFLRPNALVKPTAEKNPIKGKAVAFDAAVKTFGEPFDDSFGGGDDDGPGFAFGDDDDDASGDDFVVEELKGVRKVDTKQVSVGYATVAKKVDVRKLKRDLWHGIETVLVTPAVEEEKKNEDRDIEDDAEDSSGEKTPEKPRQNPSDGLSFQNIVRDMEQSKTQVDVSLPFYFICVLHLANEKQLRLDSKGLEDFIIHSDDGKATST